MSTNPLLDRIDDLLAEVARLTAELAAARKLLEAAEKSALDTPPPAR